MAQEKSEYKWQRSDKERGIWISIGDHRYFIGDHPNVGPIIKIEGPIGNTPPLPLLKEYQTWDEFSAVVKDNYGVDLEKALEITEIEAFRNYFAQKN